MVIANVDRHAIEPGFRVSIHAGLIPEELEKHFLCGILRILQIAEEAVGSAEHHLPMNPDKIVEFLRGSGVQAYR
jgi:hypothetical protein